MKSRWSTAVATINYSGRRTVLRNRILELMESLRLTGMKSAFDEVSALAARTNAAPERTLCDLLEAEAAERKMRAIRYQTGQAKFPKPMDLDGFNFSASPVNEREVKSLYERSFLPSKSNVILVGGTGTGKTHLAVAITSQASQKQIESEVLQSGRSRQPPGGEKLAGKGGGLAT